MATIRLCTACGHSELHHFERACAGLHKWKCPCSGFCARELSKAEVEVLLEEYGQPRGVIRDNDVAEDYSEIRRHLGKIMEQQSTK